MIKYLACLLCLTHQIINAKVNLKKPPQYWRTETVIRTSEEISYFGKNIVSSSEQLHKPNVCVAVIFIPKIK